MEKAIDQYIDVDLFGVGDFIPSTTAAALRIGSVVETILRVEDAKSSPEVQSLQLLRCAMLGVEACDIVNGMKNEMLHADGLERLLRENGCHFSTKCLVPFLGRTAGGREQETASLNEPPEIVAFLCEQCKLSFAVHDEHWKVIDFVAR